MTKKGIIEELQSKIYGQLKPLIGARTILLDCPYHINIGDLLIWKGECEFFKTIGKEPISQSSLYTFVFPKLSEDITICLHGGGNFGDLYRVAQDFRIKVINSYPNNRIIIFPQSIWYEDKSLIEKDSIEFARHKDLYICARDLTSYEFVRKNFTHNKVMLVPDMAFCIGDISETYDSKKTGKDKVLYFRRKDQEFVEHKYSVLQNITDIKDWPRFGNKYNFTNLFMIVGMRLNNLNQFWKKIYTKPMDLVMQKILKPRLIGKGIHMLIPYEMIYTTRLHAMILGILLDKKIIYIDNTTNKLSAFADTWLRNVDDVKSIDSI